MPTPIFFSALGIAIAACYLLSRISNSAKSQTVPEPPSAPQTIPIIGHVIGLMRGKFDYYVELSRRCPFPIFTINIFGNKMYVVTKPELIQAVQKQPKSLAFPPIEAHFSNKMCGSSKEASEIVMFNTDGEQGNKGISVEIYGALRDVLKPGPGLDGMNRVMAEEIMGSLDVLHRTVAEKPGIIKLASWLRNTVTMATTSANYGPGNPFKDPAVADDFWTFESDLMMILIGPYPSLLARKGCAARDRVAKAFEPYLRDCIDTSSELMKVRMDVMTRNNVPFPDIAKYEVGGSVATLVNTAPATFWMVFLVQSHPGLLEEIRQEIDAVTTHENGQYNIDLTALKENCPLLTSTYREMLRFRAVGTSVRRVMKDTVFAGQWLLKKDSLVQMPSRVLHQDPELWGSDVEEFKPHRFMKSEASKRPSDVCFRAFGGGKTLCPGRHFSTNEILICVVLFVARFDVKPVSGQWELPSVASTNIASVIMNPDTDPEVEVKPRRGFEGSTWTVAVNDSTKTFALVAEDA